MEFYTWEGLVGVGQRDECQKMKLACNLLIVLYLLLNATDAGMKGNEEEHEVAKFDVAPSASVCQAAILATSSNEGSCGSEKKTS